MASSLKFFAYGNNKTGQRIANSLKEAVQVWLKISGTSSVCDVSVGESRDPPAPATAEGDANAAGKGKKKQPTKQAAPIFGVSLSPALPGDALPAGAGPAETCAAALAHVAALQPAAPAGQNKEPARRQYPWTAVADAQFLTSRIGAVLAGLATEATFSVTEDAAAGDDAKANGATGDKKSAADDSNEKNAKRGRNNGAMAMLGAFQVNRLLTRDSFLGVFYPSLADVVAFFLVRDLINHWSLVQKVQQVTMITRWYNAMQNHQVLGPLLCPNPADMVELPLDVPPELRQTEQKKQEKKKKVDKTQAGAQAQPQQDGKKKEKGGGGGGGGGGGAKSDVPLIARVDLRVGRIVSCKKHPEADSLYVETIECGDDDGPRTVISGLVNFVPLDQMMDRLVVVVCNLKPRNMKGVKSHGMVLCASTDAHDAVELLDPPAGTAPGTRVLPVGVTGEPDKKIDPQKKNNAWVPVVPDLRVNDQGQACYQGKPLVPVANESSFITSKSLKDVPIG